MERRLTLDQTRCLKDVQKAFSLNESISLEKEVLEQGWGLSEHEARQILGVVGLIGYHLLDREQKDAVSGKKRKLAAYLINSSPGTENLRDAINGFEHGTPGRSWNGRNHTGTRKR